MYIKISVIVYYILSVTCSLCFASRRIVVPHDFPTIHAAVDEASEGDTVYVVKGRYRENIILPDGVVLMGQDMLTTIIDGQRKGPCIIGADGGVITDFTIINGTTGILCKNTRPIIKRNLILDNKGAGIHALISLPDIENNIIYRNLWTGIFLEGVRSTRTSVNHNVIVENGYSAIFCAHRTEVLIRNNIMTGNKHFGVFIGPEARKTRIIFNNMNNNRAAFNPDAVVNETNINKPSQFIDPAYPNFNYFVLPGSLCKNNGENGTDIGLITEKMIEELKVDQDGDGILDERDQCPDVPEDLDGFEDSDGCPDYDNDNDGIPDLKDQCPNEPEDVDGFKDDDGCPDVDNDKDIVLDKKDLCPNNVETYNNYKDDDGCPDEKPQEIKQALILRGVTFKTASTELLEESYYILENVFNSLEAFPNVRVEISGHTDSLGSAQYNLQLSYERAKTVMNYLVMRGISPDRIVARGYGETQPKWDNSKEESRALNRRVEIVPIK